MKITVSIILLNHNGKQFNKDCIDSILAQNYQDFEIIFVDQCSTDGSLQEVENIYKKEIKSGKIKIIKNTENNGFTGGNNLGAKHADKNSKYICLLNNDTTVPKNWLEVMINKIDNNKDLGAISCIIYDKGFENKIKNQIFINKKKQIATIFGESVFLDMSSKEINENLYHTNTLSGCCFIYRKDLIKKPFPEYYFAYAEDVFLSRYIINLGYKLGVALDTHVNHFGSGSFGNKPSSLKLFHGNKNQIINFLVFYPLFYKLSLLPLFLIKELAHLFMGSPIMRFKAKVNGRIRIIKNYKIIIITKKELKKHKKISYYDFISQLSFQLSDSYFIDNKILKLLLSFGNLLFYLYGFIVKGLFYVFNIFHKTFS